MRNPDNKDFYREDLVNDLEDNEMTKPEAEGKAKDKAKTEGKAKAKGKAEAKKATRAQLLKKLAALHGNGKSAPEEEDDNEDEESEDDEGAD